ncbi:F-type conjugal transfer pilus assembly protein TraB, partial [Klebsiella pneumoniae]|uniref:F-type conjugal transfer pilus assembly protein TraB n=1 Tax=Klebsiella pneumoniae TaxID=573 RepID=UPI001AEF6E35
FNSKVEQHATTEMQATAADLNKRFDSLQGEVDLLSKARSADQIRIDKLSSDNEAMQNQLKALGVKPAVSGGEPAPTLPYIPSGSFAKSMLIEGADANASVTGNESTVPMQLRITGRVEMPNSKTYDLTGCFVGLEAWGDVSSERAIVRTRNISCIKGDKTIDQPINGHVSFMGKNGVKGEVVMRNGKILGWAWGAGFVDGIGQGMERASQPAVGLGATASVGAGDVLKMGVGGGASKAAQTLSEYYIKRAEQYHPVIPIGAGNEVTVVFQDGFQLKTIEELEAEKNGQQQAQNQEAEPAPQADAHHQSGGGMNGFNTDEMLKKLGKLDPREFSPGAAPQGENNG